MFGGGLRLGGILSVSFMSQRRAATRDATDTTDCGMQSISLEQQVPGDAITRAAGRRCPVRYAADVIARQTS